MIAWGAAAIGARSGPLACRRPQPAAVLRVVCFAHAGGGPAAFDGWATALAPDIEVWVATLPGRAARAGEPLATDWRPLVDELATAIEDSAPDRFALVGHSLGALIAFEVARELTRRGASRPEHLVVSAQGGPAVAVAPTAPASDRALLEHVDEVYGGVPLEVRSAPEVLDRFVPILRADVELAGGYRLRPGPMLTCPITAIGGVADPTVSRAALDAWGDHTLARHRVHQVGGGHFYRGADRLRALRAIRSELLR